MPPDLTWRRLFFTRTSDLDLGYAFLIPFLLLFLVSWLQAATGRWTHITSYMWWALVTIISIMVIATVPIIRARIMASRGLGGDGMSMPYFGADASTSTFSIAPTPDAR